MNLIEMISHYQAGKEIEYEDGFYEWRDFKLDSMWTLRALLDTEFRVKITKEYPALYCNKSQKRYWVSYETYPTEESAKNAVKEGHSVNKFIRLVKEIPELIRKGSEE